MTVSKDTFFSKKVTNYIKPDAKYELEAVYKALKEKGYDPRSQMVGYLLSGDPTYITSHKSARKNFCKLERDTILEELVDSYIKNNLEKK